MKKLPLYVLTAATAVSIAGTAATTSFAAGLKTYYIPAGSQKFDSIADSISGNNSLSSLKQTLQDCGININKIDWNSNGITIPGFGQIKPILPGNSNPEICPPDTNLPSYPDNSLPSYPDNSLPSYPDNSLPSYPDNSLPGPEQPDNNLPDIGVPDDKPGTEDDENGTTTENAFAMEVVRLVNEERAKAGLPALAINQGASAAALTRSKEIVTSFSHTRPDGRTFDTALKENGVNFTRSGENIAYGQKTPQDVMQGWMNSSGHRANILNKDFTSIGVGHYKNSAGVSYWTQLFIR